MPDSASVRGPSAKEASSSETGGRTSRLFSATRLVIRRTCEIFVAEELSWRAVGTPGDARRPDGVTMVHRTKIADFAQSRRLPSMFGWREYCEVGGLASYGGNQRATYRQLAGYADRILPGPGRRTCP
jgi:hypothetical protein